MPPDKRTPQRTRSSREVTQRDEAVLNIQMAIKNIALVWETTRSEVLAEAQADLEQAVRYLTGQEMPS